MTMYMRMIWMVLLLYSFCGCSDKRRDNGEQLGYELRLGAEKLKRSQDTELIMEYHPLTGIQQVYYVDFQPSSNPIKKPNPGGSVPMYGKGYVSVSGKRGGSTTSHQLYVHVNEHFTVYKTNEATFITLRKAGERIDVVDVR